MTQFVRGVDAQATVAAGDNCAGKDNPERQRVTGDDVTHNDQHHEVQWHRGIGQPAITKVGIELRHDLFWWVVSVATDQPIQNGHHNIAAQYSRTMATTASTVRQSGKTESQPKEAAGA